MSVGPDIAVLPNHSDPPPDPATRSASASSRGGRVLSLLRKLIDYGQDLARTVQQRTTASTLLTVALHFGTSTSAQRL